MALLLAPAKVNLTLEVLGREADGYHRLRSVMVPLALFDRIDVVPSGEPSFACSDAALVGDNIVQHALASVGSRPCRVVLTKHIPVGAGLGGGSSDAAAVLRAAMDGSIPRDGAPADWLLIARTLGSDVPFFLAETGALVEGTGERVTPLGALPPWWVVVVTPQTAVSTADAYRLLDEARAISPPATRPRATSASVVLGAALQRGDFASVRANRMNDFHDVVLGAYPEVRAAYEAFTAAGASDAMLSGSGSCLYVIREHEGEARALAARCNVAAFAQTFVAALHAGDAWRRESAPA